MKLATMVLNHWGRNIRKEINKNKNNTFLERGSAYIAESASHAHVEKGMDCTAAWPQERRDLNEISDDGN